MVTVLDQMSEVRAAVSPEEWSIRVDLAAAYRLIALYGWDDLIFTHLSARVPGAEHHFLINPYAQMFEEITASSLVKIDTDGNKVLESAASVNRAGFVIHSAIHAAREDAMAVLHLHTPHGQAVSAMREGLLGYTQVAMLTQHDVAYHDFEGIATELGERERLVTDLGDKNLLILRNHGTLAVGANIPTAFLRMYLLERACEAQVLMLSAGRDALNHLNQGVAEKVTRQVTPATIAWVADDLVWPALLRKLDRIDPSYRT